MFGEIDCREGLTMAVDKLKYDTLEAAMDVLLDIYMGETLPSWAPQRLACSLQSLACVVSGKWPALL